MRSLSLWRAKRRALITSSRADGALSYCRRKTGRKESARWSGQLLVINGLMPLLNAPRAFRSPPEAILRRDSSCEEARCSKLSVDDCGNDMSTASRLDTTKLCALSLPCVFVSKRCAFRFSISHPPRPSCALPRHASLASPKPRRRSTCATSTA